MLALQLFNANKNHEIGPIIRDHLIIYFKTVGDLIMTGLEAANVRFQAVFLGPSRPKMMLWRQRNASGAKRLPPHPFTRRPTSG